MTDKDAPTYRPKPLEKDLDLSPVPVPIRFADGEPEIPTEGADFPMKVLIELHRKGWTPEMVCEEYPWLDLAETYLAIAFYLKNKEMIDAHFIESSEQATEP